MYNDIDKKFDHITQKALPYLVLAPPSFRNELVELMDTLFHQLLQRSEADFDEIYGQINEMLDSRKKFESLTENKLRNFAGRFETYGQMITETNKRLVTAERNIKSLEKSMKALSAMINKITPMEKIPIQVPLKKGDYVKPSLITIKEYLKNNREIENSIVREICGIDKDKAKYLLQKLVREGVIERSGSKYRPKYNLVKGSIT